MHLGPVSEAVGVMHAREYFQGEYGVVEGVDPHEWSGPQEIAYILYEVCFNALQAGPAGSPPGLEHNLTIRIQHRLAA